MTYSYYYEKILLTILAVVLFALGIYLGYIFWHQDKTTPTITKETIITSLKNKGFLVSQTYILNQSVEIDNSTGSKLKDIFWDKQLMRAEW